MNVLRTVWIVDGDADTAEIYSSYLREVGFLSEGFVGADEMLKALDSGSCGRPDAVVVDLVMPGLFGGNLVPELRKRAAAPTMAIVLLTSATDIGRLPADTTLALKPLGGQALVALLDQMLKRRSVRS